MRPDKAKVVDEVWDDARIDEFLNKGTMGNEPADFSILLNAYRSMRAEDFDRFLARFSAKGGNISAKDSQGRTLAQLITPHEKAAPFKEILARYS